MTEEANLTIALLRDIRDGIGKTNARLDQTVARLDQSIERQDGTNLRLDRVEASLVDLAEQQRFVVRHLRALTDRDRRIESDVDELKSRVDAIEKRIPPTR